MNLALAREVAALVVRELEPHCERIQVAGSVRRCKPEVKDIEIVCIPRRVRGAQMSLIPTEDATRGFVRDPAFVAAVDQWEAVRGKATGKYTQRLIALREGGCVDAVLDLFTAVLANWGWILAMRTGSAEFSHHLATMLNRRGYTSEGGMIKDTDNDGRVVEVPEESDLFTLAGYDSVPEPSLREVDPRNPLTPSKTRNG